MILWVSKDATHVWKKFQPFADKIPGALIVKHDTPQWKAEMAVNYYEQLSDELSTILVKFVTGIDPMAKVQVLQEGTKQTIASTHGKNIQAVQNINFKE